MGKKTDSGWEGAIEIPIDDLVPNGWNANVMSQDLFDALVREIETDGFDEPLLVVPHPRAEGKFLVINGEHRLAACKRLQFEKVPCVVKDYDEYEQKVKSVRRNLLRGELDAQKFTDLVNDVLYKDKVERGKLINDLTLGNEALFESLFREREEERKKLEKEADKVLDDKETRNYHLVGNLATALQKILEESKDGPQSFVFFAYRDRFHLIVQANEDLVNILDEMVKFVREKKLDVNDFLAGAIGSKLVKGE